MFLLIDEVCVVQQAAQIVRGVIEAKSFVYTAVQGNVSDKALLSQAWLEIGLCWHYFAFKDKVFVLISLSTYLLQRRPNSLLLQGKKFYNAAKIAAGLSVEMSAAMGVRTKWQRSDVAQLFILAKSSLYNNDVASHRVKVVNTSAAPVVSKSTQANELESNSDSVAVEEKSGWTHSEWELGRRLVSEAAGGEEAAVR